MLLNQYENCCHFNFNQLQILTWLYIFVAGRSLESGIYFLLIAHLSLDSTSGVFSSHMWRWLCWTLLISNLRAILRALDFYYEMESYWKILEQKWGEIWLTILRITLTMVLKDRRVETTAISMWDMIVAEVITVETLGGVCILDLFWK